MDEQWKRGGDCTECRRKSYCGSECTEHKEAMQRDQNEAMAKVMLSILHKAATYHDDE